MQYRQQRQHDTYNEHAIVAYDIETIVDDEPVDGSFPAWPRHRPVAAAFLSVRKDEDGYTFWFDTLMCEPGDEMAFYGKIEELLPTNATGVTYAGRSFDNLVLSLQAMRLRFDLPGLARQTYAGRYDGAHVDLADKFAGMGATRPTGLIEICKALDIPAKINTSGGEVGTLWREGKYGAIQEYVREDVIGTYMLWLHYIAFRRSDEALLMVPLADLSAWLETEPGLAHLRPFADSRPARLARVRAPALRVQAALVDAQRRLVRERDEAAFVASPF